MNSEQTPISKYLASLERRQALLTPSPQQDPQAIIRKINFEDDTFFQGDQSVLNVSPSPVPSDRQVFKRRRLSVLGEAFEDEENMNKKISELERLLSQTQGELIESRALNTKLEHQIGQIKRSNSERLVGFETSENEMRSRMKEALSQAESMKEQLNRMNKKEEELRAQLHQQVESHSEKMNVIESKLRVLESENLELKGKFESGTLRQSDELRKLSASLEETEMGAEKWVMETQLLRDQLELKEAQLQRYQTELKEAQAIIGKYNEMKNRYEQPKSPDGSSESLEEKIKYFENLYIKQQTENIRLVQKFDKINNENIMLRTSMNKEMLLEEQITNLEEEVKTLQKSLENKASIETERNYLESELNSWKSMACKLDPDCTNPLKLEAFIRKFQNQLLEAKMESSTMKLTLSNKESAITKAQQEISGLKNQVKGLIAEKENSSQELRKLSRRLMLVTKDRDGLKELKESYEQELEGVISKALQDRINQLEITVAEYEAIIQEDPSQKKSCGECEKRISLITELRSEMERLKREKTEAQTQLANMSTVGASDDGNTTGVKIVSFGLNPSALSLEARLKEAIKENEELKEKIKELQDQTMAGPSKGSDSGSNSKELEDRNKTLERKLEILSDAYDFETQQLQLIVNKLCGFHFTLIREPSIQIRLSSVYSQTQNETFIFQESQNGDMLLLESPILDNFRDDIDRFLLREGSIPGFLASVTITYVQNQNSQEGTSQLTMSQQSATEEPTVTISNPREIQVEVQRQRRPTINDPDDEAEEVEEEEENDEDVEDEEEHGHDDDDEEGEGGFDGEEDDYGEEEEEEAEHDDGESEPDAHSPPPRLMGSQRPPARHQEDDSDSDVIMID